MMLPYLSSRPCPKCGGREATTVFCGTGSRYRRYLCDRVPSHPEHLVRRCPRCGYSWDEAPLDAGVPGSATEETPKETTE